MHHTTLVIPSIIQDRVWHGEFELKGSDAEHVRQHVVAKAVCRRAKKLVPAHVH